MTPFFLPVKLSVTALPSAGKITKQTCSANQYQGCHQRTNGSYAGLIVLQIAGKCAIFANSIPICYANCAIFAISIPIVQFLPFRYQLCNFCHFDTNGAIFAISIPICMPIVQFLPFRYIPICYANFAIFAISMSIIRLLENVPLFYTKRIYYVLV